VGPAQARVAAMLLLTLRGTPTLYNGDEIGMTDFDVPAELQMDPARFDGPGRGRDPERTPMRWDTTTNAGFTSGTPWLPMGQSLDTINVAAQRSDPKSTLTLFRRLIELRRREPALTLGDWAPIAATDSVLAYERSVAGRRLVIALNLRDAAARVQIGVAGKVLLSTRLDGEGAATGPELELRPDEGVVIDVSSAI
jgi:alpha-glucosidase